jgi:hypothetical protein
MLIGMRCVVLALAIVVAAATSARAQVFRPRDAKTDKAAKASTAAATAPRVDGKLTAAKADAADKKTTAATPAKTATRTTAPARRTTKSRAASGKGRPDDLTPDPKKKKKGRDDDVKVSDDDDDE